MPPHNRQRQKRTVYLGPADETAIETIRQDRFLHTKAGAIRLAVRETERQINQAPSDRTVTILRLVEYVEALTLLSEQDKRRLDELCTEVRRILQGRNRGGR